jgi:hypothetical protein
MSNTAQQHPPNDRHPRGQHDCDKQEGCLAIPRFERLNYFYGQMLGVRELQTEQAYLREKHRLHNRYLHGHGVVCGLRVAPCVVERKDCDPQDPEPCVVVECGLAIDCGGNELVLRESVTIPLRDLPKGKEFVWISICYREIKIQPTRPASLDECASQRADCVHAMIREDVCVRTSCEPPEHRVLCGPCGDLCGDGCLVLARVRLPTGRPLEDRDIDNSVRRPLSLYETARVDRIGWTHGAKYSRDEAKRLLDEGLYFHFSRPVHAETVLAPGVLDVWVIQGGRGSRGLIQHVDTNGESSAAQGLVNWVRFKHDTDEVLQPGDRVLITLRSSFVLDECCRALDGEMSAWVPIDPHYKNWDRAHEVVQPPCRQASPRQLMPWMSGNGQPAGGVESWFFIEDGQGSPKQQRG